MDFLYSMDHILVLISDWIGLWRPILTKDTLVWTATAGLALLVGFPEAKNLGYFRQELRKVRVS
jgi:hypothetical protein